MKIYGKEQPLAALDAMFQSGRIPHGFLFYGPAGAGKKTLAQYLACKLLCEGNDAPCGVCRACRLIAEGQHPDVHPVEHSGKLEGFSVETIRHLCADAYIVPNNGARKVYLLTDADRITVQAQNALLKLVEEPPDSTYFIFTAAAKHVFLDTILSRVSAVGVSACTEAQCRAALLELGHTADEAAEAIAAFHGNLGLCLRYCAEEDVRQTVARVRQMTDCIVRRDEYGLLAALTAASADKAGLQLCLRLLDCTLRDSQTARLGSPSRIGCDPQGAETLSGRVTLAAGEKLHAALALAGTRIDGNVSPALAVSALCGALIQSGS